MDFTIREGKKQDIPQVLGLIKELAEYEKAPHEVENTEEKMLEDGFGKSPIFGFFVSEMNGVINGISVYYYRYSTWKGKRLYLEDIVVTESMRGKKIGKYLFEATIKKALEENCNGMTWQVLDWNEPALNFYKKYAATMDPGWYNGSLTKTQMQAIAQINA